MKKLVSISLILCLTFIITTAYAANGYDFRLEYTGEIAKGVEKDANVVLFGDSGALFPHVVVKVEVQGPSVPTIYAYDSNNNKIDIAQTGYWGPPGGFAVQGTFENATPVRVTFKEAGDYMIMLSLLNVDNGNAVITTKTINIYVNQTENNNQITEIPKTGMGMSEYIVIAVIVLGAVYLGYRIRMARK